MHLHVNFLYDDFFLHSFQSFHYQTNGTAFKNRYLEALKLKSYLLLSIFFANVDTDLACLLTFLTAAQQCCEYLVICNATALLFLHTIHLSLFFLLFFFMAVCLTQSIIHKRFKWASQEQNKKMHSLLRDYAHQKSCKIVRMHSKYKKIKDTCIKKLQLHHQRPQWRLSDM